MTDNFCHCSFEQQFSNAVLATHRRRLEDPLNNRQENVHTAPSSTTSGFLFVLDLFLRVDGGFGRLQTDAVVPTVAKGLVDRTTVFTCLP